VNHRLISNRIRIFINDLHVYRTVIYVIIPMISSKQFSKFQQNASNRPKKLANVSSNTLSITVIFQVG